MGRTRRPKNSLDMSSRPFPNYRGKSKVQNSVSVLESSSLKRNGTIIINIKQIIHWKRIDGLNIDSDIDDSPPILPWVKSAKFGVRRSSFKTQQ